MTQTIYASICGALIVVVGMVVRRAVIVLTVPSKMEGIHEQTDFYIANCGYRCGICFDGLCLDCGNTELINRQIYFLFGGLR